MGLKITLNCFDNAYQMLCNCVDVNMLHKCLTSALVWSCCESASEMRAKCSENVNLYRCFQMLINCFAIALSSKCCKMFSNCIGRCLSNALKMFIYIDVSKCL